RLLLHVLIDACTKSHFQRISEKTAHLTTSDLVWILRENERRARMDEFAPKRAVVDWRRIADLDLKRLTADEDKLESTLESLFPMLAAAKVEEGDPNATPANLVKLFKVTQLAMELKNMYLEGAEGQIRTFETTIKSQTEEINKLKARGAVGGGSPSADLRALREENLDLERRNETLNRELQRVEESLAKELTFTQELNIALAAEKQKMVDIEESNKKLEKEMKEREDQMTTHRQRLLTKNIEEEEFRGQLKEKNLEINKLMEEVKSLTNENSRLQAEVETMGEEMDAVVKELDRNAQEQEAAQQTLISTDILIDELTEERDMLKVKVEELSDSHKERELKDGAAVSNLKEDVDFYRDALKKAELDAIASELKAKRATGENALLRDEIENSNVNSLRKEIQERDDLIASLKEKLEESYKDFEILSLDWDKIHGIVEAKSGGELEGLKSQAALASRLKERIDILKSQRKVDTTKMRSMTDQLEERDKELLELKQRMEAYETGVFGLKDAIHEIKNLKLQRNLRDKEIAALTQRINDYDVQVGDFAEENGELRRMLGIKADTAIDLSNIRSIKSVELQKSKGLNAALKKEVENLEEERIQLKNRLRTQALATGERAVAMGLSAEDLMAVEEYVTKLRSKDDAGKNAEGEAVRRPVLSNQQLEKLTIELERVHVEAADARERVEELQAKLATSEGENRALEAAIKEMSETYVKIRQGDEKDGAIGTRDLGASEGANLPVVQKILKALEGKKLREISRDIRTKADVEDDIIKANTVLRDEILDLQRKVEQSVKEKEAAESEARKVNDEMEVLKGRAQKARKRVLNLPAELLLGSIHDYSAVVDQLIDCLMDLEVKDKELRENREALQRFEVPQHFYGMLAGKQRLLYKDYQNLKNQATSELTEAKEALRAMTLLKDSQDLKCDELEALIKMIQNAEQDTLKRALIESQRAAIVLRVNELNLKRRHMAMADTEKYLRKENGRLKEEVSDMDRSTYQAVEFLKATKEELSARLEKLQSMLAQSVPKADYTAQENKLCFYLAKTKLLLQREREWIEDKTRTETEARELTMYKGRTEDLELQLHASKEMCQELQSALEDMAKMKEHAMKAKLSEAVQRVSRLQVSSEVLERRAELAETKYKSLEFAELALKDRICELEKRYMEATEDTLRLREALVEQQNLYEGGASRDENTENLKKIDELEEKLRNAKRDVIKYKNLADIATNQAADILHLHTVDEKEKAILRATIQELQMEGDDKLIIGKLHNHIVALQVSEATIMHKLETAKVKHLQTESTLLKTERALDERESTLFHIKSDHIGSDRLFHKCISELRARIAGHVMIEKHNRTCDVLRQLNDSKAEVEKEIYKLQDQLHQMDLKLIEADSKLETQVELIAALRDSNIASERIVNWQSRMSSAQIANLRLARELELSKQREMLASKTNEEYVYRINSMEEELVVIQTEHDKQQLEWEKAQEYTEERLREYEAEREQIFSAASAADLKRSQIDKTLPVGYQLELALKLLVERSRLLTAQEIKITTLESQVSRLSQTVTHSEDKLLSKDHHIAQLRQNVAQRDLQENMTEQECESRASKIVRAREGEAMRRAQEVISSLQKQLRMKNERIQRLEEMLKKSSRDAAEKEKDAKLEALGLTEVINTLNDKQVKKLREPRVPQMKPNRDNVPDTGLIEELDLIIKAKEKECDVMREKYESLKTKYEEYRLQAEGELDKLHDEHSRLRESHDEKHRHIESLTEELEFHNRDAQPLAVLQQEAANAKILREQLGRAKKALDKKEAKIHSMTKAIAQLQDAMVQHAQEAAEARIRNKNIKEEGKNLGLISELNKANAKLNQQCQILAESNKAAQSANKELELRLRKLMQDRPTQDRDSPKSKGGSASSGRAKSSVATQTHDSASENAAASKEKWEAEKKLQRRLDGMKIKLNEKTKELEDSQRRESSLKETLERLERDRKRLQHNLSSMSDSRTSLASSEAPEAETRPVRRGGRADAPSRGKQHAELEPLDPELPRAEALLHARVRQTLQEIESTRRENYELKSEIARLDELANVTRVSEIKEIRLKCDHLEEQLKMYADLNDHLRVCSSATPITGAVPLAEAGSGEDFDMTEEPGERSKRLVIVLEARIRDLVKRLHHVEDAKLRSESDLRLADAEREKAVEAAKRLGRRATELEESVAALNQLERDRRNYIQNNTVPGLNITIGQLRSTTTRLLAEKSHDEILTVVEHLSRALEKLQLDKEMLTKGGGAANAKHAELLKELKQLRKEKLNSADLEKARISADAQASKVETENAKVRKQLRQEIDKNRKLLGEVDELRMGNDSLMAKLSAMTYAATKGEHQRSGPGGMAGPHESAVDNDHHNYHDRPRRHKDAEEIAYLKGQLAERDNIIANFAHGPGPATGHSMAESAYRREAEMWKARATKAQEELKMRAPGPLIARAVTENADANFAELYGGIGEAVADRNILQGHMEQLENENMQLKVKLSQFDDNFLADVEDLKANR
ncbi:hypothetical protein HK101_010313, partial [Irineochytrium annulatum]